MKSQLVIILYIIFLNTIYSTSNFEKLILKYEGVLEDIYIEEATGHLKAKTEIDTNKQIVIIPTRNIMSSEEKYQFQEYFLRSPKETLIGRLLIERFIGNESFFFEFIEQLPKLEELMDYYQYSQQNIDFLNIRNLVKYNFIDRKSEYEALITKIPSNVKLILL